MTVYPRVCGGTRNDTRREGCRRGLSPRMRGNPPARGRNANTEGSIPAYAGEPMRVQRSRRLRRVYPRVCGGTAFLLRYTPGPLGLSPRMRGNPPLGNPQNARRRSIPAYAGEPGIYTANCRGNAVYPRVCGGTATVIVVLAVMQGLSPRMRGNRMPGTGGGKGAAVYPRVCGGTRHPQIGCNDGGGLSPRMRGNPPPPGRRRPAGRSIPAYAGEPPTKSTTFPPASVYPRVCGGTDSCGSRNRKVCGLSPRMRGNLGGCCGTGQYVGSIPAYAGEPPAITSSPSPSAVYPRVCGGTTFPSTVIRKARGLSPRMRGNHQHAGAHAAHHRSIPAYAGEP